MRRSASRRRGRRRPSLALAAALAAAGAAPAAADAPPADGFAPNAPGALGLRLGDTEGRLHPYADLDTHWVRNPGRLSGPAVDDLESTARVGFDLALPSSTLELQGGGQIRYDRYWGVQLAATRGLSAAAGQLDLGLTLRRDGPLTLRLRETLVRSADPANQTITQRLLHWAQTTAAAVDARPGGGALVLTAGYGFFFDRYDPVDNALLAPAALDNLRHMPELRAAWKFLPKTALFVEAQMAITRFSAAHLAETTQTNVGSDMLTAYAGIAGNVSRRLSTVVKAGYGNTLMLRGGDDLQTWVGEAEIIYAAGETLRVHLGAQRSIAPTSLFRYYALSGGFLAVDAHLATGTSLAVRPAISDLRYGPSLVAPHARRHDLAIAVDVTVGQQLVSWLTVSVVERFDLRRSTYVTPVGSAGYLFNDLLLRADARY